MIRQKAHKPYRTWRDEKEMQGKMTWTLALYGTEDAAKEANLSLEEYWAQIIKACYLDKTNPLIEWKKSFEEINRIINTLNSMKIKNLLFMN
jgi:aminopeptidase